MTVKPLESTKEVSRITLRYPVRAREMRFRASNGPIPRTITHISTPVVVHGVGRNLYEVTFDVSGVSRGEPVTLEFEVLIPRSAVGDTLAVAEGRYNFETELKTDLASVWLLLPTDRPYRTYSLVRYPADRSKPPEVMQSRFTIDHPYGTLIR